MQTVFFIGATGHIGGATLHLLTSGKYADSIKVTALVRDEDKGKRFKDKFAGANVDYIIGDLKTLDLLEKGASEADVVINTAPDITHDDGIAAIIKGLNARSTPSYYIHTSGASSIWDEPVGSPEARTWDDITDIEDLKALELRHTHCPTDRMVRAAHVEGKVHVSMVSPVMVGGLSPYSSEHPVPISTGAIVTTARAFKTGFEINTGENQFGWVHVADLARIFESLANDAFSGNHNKELWGEDAYYFGTTKTWPLREWMQAILPALQKAGLVESSEIESTTVAEVARKALSGGSDQEYFDDDNTPPPADSWAMHIAIMWAINMRVVSSRAEKLLGWRPELDTVKDWADILELFLKREAESQA